MPPSPPVPLGIVIPTLDEAEALPKLLEDLTRLNIPHRILVADGGSTDETRELAREAGALVVRTSRGRGRQMNAGAGCLGTPWLLFLHADLRMPDPTLRALERWLEQPGPSDVGTFRFALRGSHWFWRFIEFGQRIREALFGLAYGDQGLLVSRDRFREAGGYPDLPLMEDVELLRALQRKGSWRKIPEPLLSSPRRYREGGRWRGWLRNTLILALYSAGVSPERLASLYPARSLKPTGTPSGAPSMSKRAPQPREPNGTTESPVLLVFAKEPVPGQVKTRLAAEVGDQEAARIYRNLGRDVVHGVAGGSYRTVVCFDPPEGERRVNEWLGLEGLEFRSQCSGDLGTRLDQAFRDTFREGGGEGRRVAVVGTDAPALARELVEKAFRSLDRADVVLGPAMDGGYYLLALKAPAPGLFQEISWSTDQVAAQTLERAMGLDLTVSVLPTLRDVDTLEDWEAYGGGQG